jgi:hypothetical protein
MARNSSNFFIYLGKQQAIKVPENHVKKDVNSSLNSMPRSSNIIFHVFKLLQIFEI